MIMIGDFGKYVKITGHLEQVALELGIAARKVREGYCERMGERDGNELFELIIANARKTDSEMYAEAEEEYRRSEMEDPELVRSFNGSALVRDLTASLKG